MDAPPGSILLVDDLAMDRDLAVRELRRSGVLNDVVVVESGMEALDYLLHTGSFAETTHAFPLVMLLDLRLPLVDGVEVLRLVREDPRTQALPVIILMGGFEADVDAMQCFSLRADGVLAKPLAFMEFARVLRHIGLGDRLLMRTGARPVRRAQTRRTEASAPPSWPTPRPAPRVRARPALRPALR